MRKLFKKVLAGAMALAMVAGLGVSSVSAADAKDVVVTVTWTEAAGEEASIWAWDADGNNYTGGTWPGAVMTYDAAAKSYSITLKDVTADAISLIPSTSLGQTVDIENASTSTGYINVTVGAKGDDGKYAGTAEAVAAPSTTPDTTTPDTTTPDTTNKDTATGDSSSVMFLMLVAAVAAGTTVIAYKKKAQAE